MRKLLLTTCCLISLLGGVLLVNFTALGANNTNAESLLDASSVKHFGKVFAHIKQYYVKKISDNKLFIGAIRGMLSALDPHSMYLNERDLKTLKMHTEGDFVGLGVRLTQEKGIVKVISPLDDTPAEKAGIKPGDFILSIDDMPLIDTSLKQVIDKMRGKIGTPVKLTVINEKDGKLRQITLKRAVIHVKSVKSKLLNRHFGYIRITNFQQQTVRKMIAAISRLKRQTNNQLYGLILDLRNNPGGLLKPSADVADAFLDSKKLGKNKLIFYAKGRIESANLKDLATPKDVLHGAPIVVLINGGSASGAEIVAGALQDHKRAIIMGEHSFGKGSIQTILPLNKKTALKLTTAIYHTPLGHAIQTKGIAPDIEVEQLTLQKKQEEANFLSKIREIHLGNHLKGDKKLKKEIKQNNTKLATEDYQLYEALNLLKSLHILKSSK